MGILLSIRNSLLGYSDAYGEVNNPLQKSFDWNRQYLNIPTKSATSDSGKIAPGESLVIFDGQRNLPTPMSTLSTNLSVSLIDSKKSIYRLSISSGAGAFRTERALGLTATSSIQVSISNNALATFTLTGSGSFSTVQIGDILRIKGLKTHDTSNVVFSSINSGYWVVLSASATVITAKRLPPQCFEGVNETVVIGTNDTANQFRVYSSSGIQVGDSFEISGTFSSLLFKAYSVRDVGPNFVDFVSGTALPNQGPLLLGSLSDLIFYTKAKKLVYIESDQRVVVKYNNQSGSENVIDPIVVGSEKQPGFSMKYGHAYKCVIENPSDVDSVNVKWILSE
jgi:hypothetical protein